MTASLLLVVVIIFFALLFDFINGFHGADDSLCCNTGHSILFSHPSDQLVLIVPAQANAVWLIATGE